VVIHLVDSFVLTRPSLYISALLLSLRSMLQMDLPTLNVLTKIDNLVNYPPLLFNLDFYTEVHELKYLLPHLDAEISGHSISAPPSDTVEAEEPEPPPSKYAALNAAIVDLIEDFALVGFEPLAVEDRVSMTTLLHAIDRAGGYAFGGSGGANDTVWQVAAREGATTIDVRDVQERWIDRREEFDAVEREAWKREAEEFRSEEPVGEGMGTDGTAGFDGSGGGGRGMMGRDSGISIVRKKPPAAEDKSSDPAS
jgi:GPN-loop GTPase